MNVSSKVDYFCCFSNTLDTLRLEFCHSSLHLQYCNAKTYIWIHIYIHRVVLGAWVATESLPYQQQANLLNIHLCNSSPPPIYEGNG